MGYMGFGMRKEVYKRKPKKAFEKLKENYSEKGLEIDTPSPLLYEDLKSVQKGRFKQFYQTKTFKITWVVILTCICAYLSWSLYFETKYLDYQQNVFEREGIYKYYDKHQLEIEKVKKFFSERSDRIKGIEYHFFQSNLVMVICSPNLKYTLRDSITRMNSPSKWYNARYQIEGTKLLIKSKGYVSRIINNNWIYYIDLRKPELFTPSILEYLKTTRTEIFYIINIIEKNKWLINNETGRFELIFKHPRFEQYTLLFTKKKLNIDSLFSNDIVIDTIKKAESYWIKYKER